MAEETEVKEQEQEIDFENLSDEDLEKLTAPQSEPASSPEAAPETPTATPTEPAKTPEAEAKPQPTLEDLQRQIAEYNANQEKFLKQLRDKELFIQRQGNEIGQLRKDRKTYEQRLKEIDEKFLESPSQATLELQKLEGERMQEQQAMVEQAIRFNQQSVHQVVQDFEPLLPEMAQELLEDGLPKEAVESFQRTPWFEPTSTLINIAKRVLAKRELAKVKTENDALRKEIESLKKKPDELARKISLAASQTRPISAASGGAAVKSAGDAPTKPIHEMSDDELKQYLKDNP